MEINLNAPKKIVLQAERSKDITKLTIERVIDFPSEKIVKCYCEELQEPVTLWEGDDYDTIGQWTDSDVLTKLDELFNS